MDLIAAAKNHFMELNELIELRDGAYENTRIYKERTMKWHDPRIRGDNDFKMHKGSLNQSGFSIQRIPVYGYGVQDLAGKEIDKVGEVSIIWNPTYVVVMIESRRIYNTHSYS
uniref:Uncharacterized protein n=1 Tax=Tanacetum cinerariifolium TaxID=118510 RepID=A0A6L2KJL3_TANCI|nr:hypothetical protein [Tanacetum cinerariifolium]